MAALSLAAGCGPDRAFERARALEERRSLTAAVDALARFADRWPSDPRAAEALVRAARIHAREFGRCPEARRLFERAAREHSVSGGWAQEARHGLMECPDFLPLRDGGTWTYVDSETGGKSMRLEFSVRASSDGFRGEAEGAYFAGKTRVQAYRRRWEKEEWAVWEREGRDRVMLMKFPFEKGMSWTAARGGRPVALEVVSTGETVKVKAGTFHDCMKIRESSPGAAAWKYDYYAHGVGKVKTTVGGRGFETPNTELAGVRWR